MRKEEEGAARAAEAPRERMEEDAPGRSEHQPRTWKSTAWQRERNRWPRALEGKACSAERTDPQCGRITAGDGDVQGESDQMERHLLQLGGMDATQMGAQLT